MLDLILTNMSFDTSKNIIFAKYLFVEKCPYSCVEQIGTFNKAIFYVVIVHLMMILHIQHHIYPSIGAQRIHLKLGLEINEMVVGCQ